MSSAVTTMTRVAVTISLTEHAGVVLVRTALRCVKDQLGHTSIEETEGTYGHLEQERAGAQGGP